MPRKKRNEKRRIDPRAECEAWEGVFIGGHDFFGEARALGVRLDDHGKPDPDDAAEAWHRLGTLFLADRRPDPKCLPWALATFGEPLCR